MIEVIKLAKLYKLEGLFKSCEGHFKELMVQSFDCTNLIALKSSIQGGQITSNSKSRKMVKEGGILTRDVDP